MDGTRGRGGGGGGGRGGGGAHTGQSESGIISLLANWRAIQKLNLGRQSLELVKFSCNIYREIKIFLGLGLG